MRMFSILLLCFVLTSLVAQNSLVAQEKDPVLFTVADEPVYLSEFKYIYEKNNAANADYSEQSLSEYLDLYKKFKLKVRRAKEIGLDTVQVLQKELEGYRKQLAKSYLKDKEISERLVDEVAERMKEDIEISHIFIGAPPKSSKDKMESAEKKINDIYDKIQELGPDSFGDMAKTLSEDKASAVRSGRLGYYTSPLPDGFYEFENTMYSTKSGEVSKPVKSKMGYHILKVKERRAARGEMEIAHILVRKPKPGAGSMKKTKVLVDSVYNLLKAGRNFENMAAKFSEDSKSKSKGGYLGYFGVNQYELSFENAAFALKNDNDFSKPIETKLGYHIIKRLTKRDNSDNNRLRKRIQARINKNDRFKIAEEKMINDVKTEAGFKEDKMSLKRFSTSLDETFYSYKWEVPEYDDNLKLFTLAGTDYTLNDFAKYAKTNVRERLKFSKRKPLQESAEELYADYMNEQVMNYEEANLERKYPDFKALMREYREGILLFEITKQEVWDKASQDTVGLQSFFESTDKSYLWPERVNVIKYSIDAGKEMDVMGAYRYAQKRNHDKFLDKYKDGKIVRIKFSEELMNADAPELADLEMKKDGLSQLKLNPAPAVFYRYKSSVKPSEKSLAEAKGYVIADYQDHLEKEWIKKLTESYPISLDQKILKSITR